MDDWADWRDRVDTCDIAEARRNAEADAALAEIAEEENRIAEEKRLEEMMAIMLAAPMKRQMDCDVCHGMFDPAKLTSIDMCPECVSKWYDEQVLDELAAQGQQDGDYDTPRWYSGEVSSQPPDAFLISKETLKRWLDGFVYKEIRDEIDALLNGTAEG